MTDQSTESAESLAAGIERVGSAVELLRNSPAPPTVFPVAPEFSNWRCEQRAWRTGCALLDQSHHMTDLFLDGPDALSLLTHLGVNTFAGFTVDKAKQYVAVNSEGYLIGDAVLFHLERERFELVGHPMVIDWVQYNLAVGGYDVSAERDGNSIVRQGTPKLYRYELQGPTAVQVVERAIGHPVPEITFFAMARFTIAGHEVRALRHGMAGQPGFELFGPWADGAAVLDALLEAGSTLGLVRAGARAYSTANLESGWVPAPLPAIFSGTEMTGYRQWLDVGAAGSLGGSFDAPDIADYYLSPYDLGYGRTVCFDHEFVGRAALERFAQQRNRTKVTLVWSADDVMRIFGSWLGSGDPAKYLEMPKARYALYQMDTVLVDGEVVGVSLDCGYLANERAFVSLATIDNAHCAPGSAVTVVWGESPNSSKPQVEPHVQTEVRAMVAPAPYVQFARGAYRSA